MLQTAIYVIAVAGAVVASLIFLPASFLYGLPIIAAALVIILILSFSGLFRGRYGGPREDRDSENAAAQGVAQSPGSAQSSDSR